MVRIALAVSALLLLSGCASQPPVSELRAGVRNATFIQYGTEPLNYTFGVVDTGSFWAAYGSSVSGNLGGSLLAEGAAASGRADVAKKAPEAAAVMKKLYGDHSMVNDVSRSVMPQLAQIWGVPYAPRDLHIVQPSAPLEDAQGNLIAGTPTTDLVLAFAFNNLTLTEKFSMGGALAAGFTMGTNTKKVAAQTTVTMHAYKQDPASAQYKKVWTGLCQGPAMYSKVEYPFPEVIQSQDKARELWDAIVPVTIDSCSKALRNMEKS
jgi:hypothetical protein